MLREGNILAPARDSEGPLESMENSLYVSIRLLQVNTLNPVLPKNMKVND
jgi:hypothetical protein